jgi:cytochrome P450
VFDQDRSFGVVYEPRMRLVTGGPNFFLGMNESEEYRETLQRWASLFSRDDLDSVVGPLVTAEAQRCCDASGGTIAVTTELATPVVCEFVEQYIGLRGIDRSELVSLTTTLFEYLFAPWPIKAKREAVVGENARRFRALVEQSIAEQKRQTVPGDDILSRALTKQRAGVVGFSDAEIRDNLVGIVIGAIPTTIKSSALALDWLLYHRSELAQAQETAKNSDRDVQFGVIQEALRFNPFAPVLMRRATSDGYVAAKRPRTIKAGALVVVGLVGAMSDPATFASPNKFDRNRPSNQYLHFGSGLHQCFGLQLNSVQLSAIVGELLRRPGLQRVSKPRFGPKGTKQLSVSWTGGA